MRAIVNRNYNIQPNISKISELHLSELNTQVQLNKEIIRRLRIQNKKLIEQVSSLRSQLKKDRSERTRIMGHLRQIVEKYSIATRNKIKSN